MTTAPDTRADIDFADAPKVRQTDRAIEIRHQFNQVRLIARSDYSQTRITFHAADAAKMDSPSERPKLPPSVRPALPYVKGRIINVPRKRKCDGHLKKPTLLVPMKKTAVRSLVDIGYLKTGCRKTVVRFVGKVSRCPHCGWRHVPPAIKRMRGQIYGPGISIWIVYLRMVLRLSYRLIVQFNRDLLGIDISSQGVDECVRRSAKLHAQTENLLLRKILKSPAIHVDETKISILGSHQYVWVLTDGKHVIFRLTEGRETGFLEPLLADYRGTLVSDFYGGYDALPCRQQKCIVHLVRDLNDDLWDNPFNTESESFVASVRDLLLPIISDVQKFGLRTFHLRKDRSLVAAFYEKYVDSQLTDQDLIARYQKRFQRYRGSMFTFLESDGIPWNNNAAERSLRHLAVQRKISGAFSREGAQYYIRLLGVAQSCRFQEKSFLGFLRSGLLDVDSYREPRSRRRHSHPIT